MFAPPILFQSDLLTVLDGRKDIHVPLRDVKTKNWAFLNNDFKWADNQVAMQKSASGLEAVNSPFRFLVVLNDIVKRSEAEINFYRSYLPTDDQHVNCVLFNNIGTEETHIPLTSWMLLHRAMHIVHANSHKFDNIGLLNPLADLAIGHEGVEIGALNFGWDVSPAMSNMCSMLLTSRAGRKKMIANSLDWSAEMLAQHCFGGIRLLRAENWVERDPEIDKVPLHSPQYFLARRIFCNTEMATLNRQLVEVEQRLNINFAEMISSMKGTTYSF